VHIPTAIPRKEIKSKNKSDSRNPTENAQDSDPSIKSQQTRRTKEWNRRIQRDKWNARRRGGETCEQPQSKQATIKDLKDVWETHEQVQRYLEMQKDNSVKRKWKLW